MTGRFYSFILFIQGKKMHEEKLYVRICHWYTVIITVITCIIIFDQKMSAKRMGWFFTLFTRFFFSFILSTGLNGQMER